MNIMKTYSVCGVNGEFITMLHVFTENVYNKRISEGCWSLRDIISQQPLSFNIQASLSHLLIQDSAQPEPYMHYS